MKVLFIYLFLPYIYISTFLYIDLKISSQLMSISASIRERQNSRKNFYRVQGSA